MKNIKFVLLIILSLLLSCNKENNCDCLKGTGDIITEHRAILPFHKIHMQDNINLYISIDSIYSLSVEAGGKLLSSVITEVKDSCLYLKNENKCNWVRSYKNKINVYISCKTLIEIMRNKASGNVYTLDTIYSNLFQINSFNGGGEVNLKLVSKQSFFKIHTGPDDIIVNGRSENAYIYSSGNGLADLSNFSSNYAIVSTKSTNNCYIKANKELEVFIDYVGNIYYSGNPAIIKINTTGSGKLIKMD